MSLMIEKEMKEKNKSISVIIMCSKKHLSVWKLTSQMLINKIKADEFTLYVPEDEIEEFREVTPKIIKIEKQESLGRSYFSKLYNKIKDCNNVERFGWYLQQFYKIEALTKANSDVVVIWDSDCVPIKKIKFTKEDKLLFMRCSNECHKPYFDNIEKLLGIKKTQALSFVIPGFPFKSQWIDEFIKDIEKNNQLYWYDALINITDLKLKSGFSETETLGTWMTSKHPNEWELIEGNWERLGQSRFGFATSMNIAKLEKIGKNHDLDIVSFENWDDDNLRKKLKRVAKTMLDAIKK